MQEGAAVSLPIEVLKPTSPKQRSGLHAWDVGLEESSPDIVEPLFERSSFFDKGFPKECLLLRQRML